jgi:Transposase IS116/IS110/IS902 family.
MSVSNTSPRDRGSGAWQRELPPIDDGPGIGPLIASAMVAAIGNGAAFAKGRDFAAWLGLVPKQMSTGDRTILGPHHKTR